MDFFICKSWHWIFTPITWVSLQWIFFLNRERKFETKIENSIFKRTKNNVPKEKSHLQKKGIITRPARNFSAILLKRAWNHITKTFSTQTFRCAYILVNLFVQNCPHFIARFSTWIPSAFVYLSCTFETQISFKFSCRFFVVSAPVAVVAINLDICFVLAQKVYRVRAHARIQCGAFSKTILVHSFSSFHMIIHFLCCWRALNSKIGEENPIYQKRTVKEATTITKKHTTPYCHNDTKREISLKCVIQVENFHCTLWRIWTKINLDNFAPHSVTKKGYSSNKMVSSSIVAQMKRCRHSINDRTDVQK